MNLQTQIENCYSLLNYIDGPFQERLSNKQVDWRFEMNDCCTRGCLLGWYSHDVKEIQNFAPMECGPIFGLDYTNGGIHFDSDYGRVFGYKSSGDIHARRAALVSHIKHLEAHLPRNFAQELMQQIESGPVLVEESA